MRCPCAVSFSAPSNALFYMLPTKMNVLSLTRKMADPWLDTIEQRLGVLEKQIFGESDKDADYPKVIH